MDMEHARAWVAQEVELQPDEKLHQVDFAEVSLAFHVMDRLGHVAAQIMQRVYGRPEDVPWDHCLADFTEAAFWLESPREGDHGHLYLYVRINHTDNLIQVPRQFWRLGGESANRLAA